MFKTLDANRMMKIKGGQIWVDVVFGYIVGKVFDWAFKPIKCY